MLLFVFFRFDAIQGHNYRCHDEACSHLLWHSVNSSVRENN